MLDDAGNADPDFDLRDMEHGYRKYIETCRRAGVEPVPRDRAQDLMAKWSNAIAARLLNAVAGDIASGWPQ